MSEASIRRDSGHGARAPRASRARARLLAAAVLLGLVALAVGACSEKITTPDPDYIAPEGVPSPKAGLVVWREIPNRLYLFQTGEPCGDPPVPDLLLDSIIVVTDPPGTLHGMISDSTVADAYQVYRRESNGGILELFDFAYEPTRRWFDRGWEIYHFTDPDTAVPTRTYLGRGVVDGAVTPAAPVTNEASDQVRSVININYTGILGGQDCNHNPIPLDSLFVMEWESVPNATGYYIHVFQPSFNLIRLPEQIASGRPAPLFIGKSRDILIAYMPAQASQPARISLPMPTPGARPLEARVWTARATRFSQEYLVRIAAVDASNQLIAYTYGSYSQHIATLPDGTQLPASQHAAYFIGAARLLTTRDPNAFPAPARRTRSPRS